MRTSELTGAALDWAVRYALNGKPPADYVAARDNFSACWNKGGPIIEREKIKIYALHESPDIWAAQLSNANWVSESVFCHQGKTPLTAAMRCYVASKLGDTVEVPKELTI